MAPSCCHLDDATKTDAEVLSEKRKVQKTMSHIQASRHQSIDGEDTHSAEGEPITVYRNVAPALKVDGLCSDMPIFGVPLMGFQQPNSVTMKKTD